MKLLYETPSASGFNESATGVMVYRFDTPEEIEEFAELPYGEMCDRMGVHPIPWPTPGTMGKSCEFWIQDALLIIIVQYRMDT